MSAADVINGWNPPVELKFDDWREIGMQASACEIECDEANLIVAALLWFGHRNFTGDELARRPKAAHGTASTRCEIERIKSMWRFTRLRRACRSARRSTARLDGDGIILDNRRPDSEKIEWFVEFRAPKHVWIDGKHNRYTAELPGFLTELDEVRYDGDLR